MKPWNFTISTKNSAALFCWRPQGRSGPHEGQARLGLVSLPLFTSLSAWCTWRKSEKLSSGTDSSDVSDSGSESNIFFPDAWPMVPEYLHSPKMAQLGKYSSTWRSIWVPKVQNVIWKTWEKTDRKTWEFIQWLNDDTNLLRMVAIHDGNFSEISTLAFLEQ